MVRVAATLAPCHRTTRQVRADLRALIDEGLVVERHNANGIPGLYLTRQGEAILESLHAHTSASDTDLVGGDGLARGARFIELPVPVSPGPSPGFQFQAFGPGTFGPLCWAPG